MHQPRPQGLLLLQTGGRRNPWPRLLKYSTNRGVFCHVTHDEMVFVGGCFQRLVAPFVFCNRKLLFKQNEDISSCLRDEILTNFRSHFGSLGQGFLRPPFWTRRRPWGRGWLMDVSVQRHASHNFSSHLPSSNNNNSNNKLNSLLQLRDLDVNWL